MTIGIDLSPLQGSHRMRGIGSVVSNLISHMPESVKSSHAFVFYMDPDKESKKNALASLDLEDINYEIRDKPFDKYANGHQRRRGLLSKIIKKMLSWWHFIIGQTGYDFSGLDAYLLTDQLQIMPRMKGVDKIMIAYDLIPFIMEWDYLISYKTARARDYGHKAALAAELQRYIYISKVRINARKSRKVVAISEQTKSDFIHFAKTPAIKIETIHLGVSKPSDDKELRPSKRYLPTSWGYMARAFDFNEQIPFILFVGGTDARRKLDSLVTAFNHVRAQGHRIQLVLSGDILQGPNNLPVRENREALLNSSYADDIIYLGFTDETVKNWLYKHALAFIYPSVYEGFGLPVLEAMSYGTPVICYKNNAVEEVALSHAIYANDSAEICESIIRLLGASQKELSVMGEKSKRHALKFDWSKTSSSIFGS